MSGLPLLIFYAGLQLFILPPDGFFAGDQGAKLLQTRATLAHGPFRPWIEGPAQDLDTELQYQEPILLRRDDGGHLIGVFPWILPTVTAPFYWLFGLHGLYVVPALSIAVTFVAARRLGRKLGTPAAGLSSAWCAIVATPVLFYGAEFWEHAPAVALTTSAAALAVPDGSARRIERDMLIGGSVGLAAAFRPEAAMMLPAIVIAIAGGIGLRQAWRPACALVLGFVFVMALTIPANAAVYGTVVPPDVSSNVVFGWAHYGTLHGEIIRALLLPASGDTFFVGIAMAIAALALSRGSSTARVYACHALVVLLAFFAVGAPLWRFAIRGEHALVAFNMTSIAHTWPFAFATVYVVALPTPDVNHSVERYLLLATALFIAGTVAVIPHPGGTQWSARFLLPAAPLAAVLASEALGRFELARSQAASIRAAAAAVIVLSVIVQGLSLVVLAHDKDAHARVTNVMESLTEPGDVIVSDLYWVPELASRLYSSRRLLFAHSAQEVTAIADRAGEKGISRLSIVTSVTESSYRPPPLLLMSSGAPFVQTRTDDIGVRNLELYLYQR